MKNEIGKIYGKLTILSVAEPKKNKKGWAIRMVKCKCDCGNEVTVKFDNIKRGATKSCGCFRVASHKKNLKKSTTHGHCINNTKTRTYRTWISMRNRCNNPKNNMYYRYGGIGITVCERWNSFVNFLEDMGERPLGTSIDRIDNFKLTDGYSKSNCRWATPTEQILNQRRNQIKI